MEASNRSTENAVSSEIQTLQKKVAFLESENKELASQKDNLQETLGINKQILNGVLSGVINDEQDILDQLQEESEVLIGTIQRMAAERDDMASRLLVVEQINLEMSRK